MVSVYNLRWIQLEHGTVYRLRWEPPHHYCLRL